MGTAPVKALLLPNVLIIGVIKCGTTALWYNLDKHPNIHMATPIDMNFWVKEKFHKGLDWYSAKFEKGKINGEKTATYWSNKKSMEAIQLHIPDAKLLLCIRNPIDRAYSNYQMHNARKPTPFNADKYFNAGRYIEVLEENVLPLFDRAQLHVCVMERMKADPTTEMGKVFNFLGVDDLKLPKKVINIMKHGKKEKDKRKNRNEPYYRVWDRWPKRLDGMPRQRLAERYAPHNKKLFEFMGEEIEEWKEPAESYAN